MPKPLLAVWPSTPQPGRETMQPSRWRGEAVDLGRCPDWQNEGTRARPGGQAAGLWRPPPAPATGYAAFRDGVSARASAVSLLQPLQPALGTDYVLVVPLDVSSFCS